MIGKRSVVGLAILLAAFVVSAAESFILRSGYSRVDITPPMGVTMPGYYNVRYAKGVLDPLSIVGLVFCDGLTTAVILQVDTAHISTEVADGMRTAVAKATGISPDAVIVHSSHTHTGGNLAPGNPLDPPARPEAVRMDELYAKMAVTRAADAAVAAIADLHPARLSVGRSTARRISFGRNYLMRDGKVRTNPGVGNPDIVRAVGSADETVQVLRIDRDGEKPICVINFQTHPDVVGGEAISADWPGLTRTVFEAATRGEAHCIVLNGTQGDVNHVNVMPRPGEGNWLHRDFDDVDRGYGHARHMANVLAAAALSVWMKCESVPSGAVRAGQREVKVPAHKALEIDEKNLAWANGIWARHEEGKDSELPWKGMELTTKLARAQRIRRMSGHDNFHFLPLSAVTIGESVAFGGFPGEPFNGIGVDVRARSPFRLTMLMCMANNCRGYFPTAESFEQDGYEAASCPFGPTVAKVLSDGILDLFETLKTGR